MQIRRQSGVPTAPPHVGNDELLLDEVTGRLYQSPTGGGAPEAITYAPSALGGGEARGVDAVDFQYTRASANDVAGGDRSFIAGGRNNTALGDDAHAEGDGCEALGAASHAQGRGSAALGAYSTVEGRASFARLPGEHAHASGLFAVDNMVGGAQYSRLVVRGRTTDATPTELFLDGVAASEQLVLENGRSYLIRVDVIGINEDSAEYAGYQLSALVKRKAGAGTTAMISAVSQTVVHEDVATWDATLQADAVGGAVQVMVTGAAAANVRWVATVEWTQISTPAGGL